MKIDNKYFIPFVLIVAGVSAVIIAYFTIHIKQERQQTFLKHIQTQDSLKYAMMPIYFGDDSLGVQSFESSVVVLNFWATWTAEYAKKAHEQLATLKNKYPQKIQIITAVVQDKPPKVKKYLKRHEFPFHYVKGTKVFEKFNLPGVPIQLVYSSDGELLSVFTGRADSTRLDSLKNMITNG